MSKIIIVVKDGVVSEVYVDDWAVNVTILDEDVEAIGAEQKAECDKLRRAY